MRLACIRRFDDSPLLTQYRPFSVQTVMKSKLAEDGKEATTQRRMMTENGHPGVEVDEAAIRRGENPYTKYYQQQGEQQLASDSQVCCYRLNLSNTLTFTRYSLHLYATSRNNTEFCFQARLAISKMAFPALIRTAYSSEGCAVPGNCIRLGGRIFARCGALCDLCNTAGLRIPITDVLFMFFPYLQSIASMMKSYSL